MITTEDSFSKLTTRFIRGLFFPLLIIVSCVILGACQTKVPVVFNELTRNVACGDPPRSIAVLPFQNSTGTPHIDRVVRDSIYGHLCVLPYRDVELSLIDRRLHRYRLTDREKIMQTPMQKLGSILGCDAILFGEVISFQRVYAGLYSQMAIEAEIQIWDTRSGCKIWEDRHIARIHEGSVPLNIILVPLISLRTGWNMREEVKYRVVDELSQYFATRIPSPECAVEPTYEYRLQVGAFFEEPRAKAFVDELKAKGYKAHVQSNRDDRGLWHRIIIGPYRDKEKVQLIRKQIRNQFGVESFVCGVTQSPKF